MGATCPPSANAACPAGATCTRSASGAWAPASVAGLARDACLPGRRPAKSRREASTRPRSSYTVRSKRRTPADSPASRACAWQTSGSGPKESSAPRLKGTASSPGRGAVVRPVQWQARRAPSRSGGGNWVSGAAPVRASRTSASPAPVRISSMTWKEGPYANPAAAYSVYAVGPSRTTDSRARSAARSSAASGAVGAGTTLPRAWVVRSAPVPLYTSKASPVPSGRKVAYRSSAPSASSTARPHTTSRRACRVPGSASAAAARTNSSVAAPASSGRPSMTWSRSSGSRARSVLRKRTSVTVDSLASTSGCGAVVPRSGSSGIQ